VSILETGIYVRTGVYLNMGIKTSSVYYCLLLPPAVKAGILRLQQYCDYQVTHHPLVVNDKVKQSKAEWSIYRTFHYRRSCGLRSVATSL